MRDWRHNRDKVESKQARVSPRYHELSLDKRILVVRALYYSRETMQPTTPVYNNDTTKNMDMFQHYTSFRNFANFFFSYRVTMLYSYENNSG